MPLSRGAAALAEAVASGILPMRQEVVNVVANVEDIEEGLSSMRVSYESLARGHERVIKSMQSIKEDLLGGFSSLNDNMKLLLSARVDGSHKPADDPDLMMVLDDVRRGFKDTLVTRIGRATRSTHVLGNTDDTWSDAVAVVRKTVGLEADDATDWLLRTIRVPSRKRPSELVSMRTSVPILRAKPHFMQQVKEVILAAWYSAVEVSRGEQSKEDASLWLQHERYALSACGWGGIVAGMDVLFRLVHAVDRIHAATTVGGRAVIHCTVGHFALVASHVRSALEVRAELRPPRRNGVGEGVYELWKAELGRLNERIPKDDTEHNGVRFVDGYDAMRAVFSSESEDEEENGGDVDDGNGAANDDEDVAMDDSAGQ